MDRKYIKGAIGTVSILYEDNHTKEEYFDKFAEGFNEGRLWSFCELDILTVAIEPETDMLYWKINGRYYETDIFVRDGKLINLATGEEYAPMNITVVD